MSEVTNAQLMNAIKLLTRKVEELQEEVAGLKRGKKPKAELPENFDKIELKEVDKQVIKAVVEHRNLKEAAEALSTTEGALKKLLESSGIPHLMYEPWAKAIKRHIDNAPIVDDYTYPEAITEHFDKILKYVPKEGIKEIAAKIGVPMKVLARYMWLQGYNTKAEFIGKPTFKIS